ncbi:retinitis pigmentosa 9 protein isoform X1 [Peromyscus californicus insignis]|uniref:retinitis pigmentosa 9 protein isoform X1 n=1 Tax=Peromyscus californicus insignis TaxID=564181 RepID=UPI0022A6BFA1|nr:retinitis pigmentosa 9 protein isoform X1 [Peromyscus californicus insignis]
MKKLRSNKPQKWVWPSGDLGSRKPSGPALRPARFSSRRPRGPPGPGCGCWAGAQALRHGPVGRWPGRAAGRRKRLAASSQARLGSRCRPGPVLGGRGSRRSRSCSGGGSRNGGGTTRSSCSSSSTWSPCWRCKRYGHRTGDKECPFFIKGNQKLEQFRVAHEDPMYDIIRENKRHEKDVRIQQLKQLLEDSTSDESSSSSSGREKRKKKKKKEKHKKRKKEKKKRKKRKHKASKSSESSDSE